MLVSAVVLSQACDVQLQILAKIQSEGYFLYNIQSQFFLLIVILLFKVMTQLFPRGKLGYKKEVPMWLQWPCHESGKEGGT